MNKRVFAAIILLFMMASGASSIQAKISLPGPDDLAILHEKTFKINPGKLLKLEGASGDVIVTTWDKSEVYVKVLGNDKAKEKIEFSFENSNDVVEVIAKREGSLFNRGNGIRIRFEIKVPVNFNTNLYTSGGDLRLAGVSGNITAKTSGGDIAVKYTTGELNISTSGGDINLENNKGKIKASTSGGDISGKGFEGSLKVSTSGGDINLEGKNSAIDASTSGGDVELRYTGENKGIELSTSGGDIDVYIPSDFDAYAKLNSSGGGVKCDFAVMNVKKISSSRFEADLNKGGKPLIAKTSGGSINVRKI